MEWLRPAWWEKLIRIAPRLADAISMELVGAANQAIKRAAPVVLDGFGLASSVVAEPLAFDHEGHMVCYGSVSTLALSKKEFRETACIGWVARHLERGSEVAPVLELLHSKMPGARVAEYARQLLRFQVNSYTSRVRDAYSYRLQIAAEQARNQHFLVRAESLERKLLKGTAEVDKVRAGSGGILDRELAAILDNPFIGVTIEDTDHVVRYLNPMLRRIYGNIIGRKCYEALKGRTNPCDECPISLIWEQGQESVRHTSVEPHTGRSFEVTTFPLVSEGGDKLVVEVGIDTTRLMKRMNELQGQKELFGARIRQLERMVEQLNSVLLDMAGDLGKLLVGSFVFGQSRSAASEWMATEVTSERVALLNRVFDEVTTVVHQASMVALAMASPAPPTIVDVGPLASGLAREMASELGGVDIRLVVPVIPTIRCDPNALSNLIGSLMRRLATELESHHVEVHLSHTMSGNASSIAPGDAYHVLMIGSPPGSPSQVPPAGGAAPDEEEPVAPGRSFMDVHWTTASLLVARLGGALWEAVGPHDMRLACFTVPATPPTPPRK
jgi:PAS domain-containing protein